MTDAADQAPARTRPRSGPPASQDNPVLVISGQEAQRQDIKCRRTLPCRRAVACPLPDHWDNLNLWGHMRTCFSLLETWLGTYSGAAVKCCSAPGQDEWGGGGGRAPLNCLGAGTSSASQPGRRERLPGQEPAPYAA